MKLIPIPLIAVIAFSMGSAAQAEHEKNLVERVIDRITGEPTPAEKLVEAQEEKEEALEEAQEAKEETDEAVVEAAEANVEVIEKATAETKAKQELTEATQRVEAAKAGIAATIKADTEAEAKVATSAKVAEPAPAAKPPAKVESAAVAAPVAAAVKAETPAKSVAPAPVVAVPVVAKTTPMAKPVAKPAAKPAPKPADKPVVAEPQFRLPAGTYKFMYDDGSHAYYYGSDHIVRVAPDRSYNSFEGDFRFGFGDMLFRRDGKEVTVRDNTGTYSFNGTGPILYEPSAIWAMVMDDINSGNFNTPRGTYSIKTNGTIEFRSTVQHDDIVIQ